MRRLLLWIPLGVFLVVAGFFVVGLVVPKDNTIRSQMVGKPVPEFALPPAFSGRPAATSAALATGEPRILNVFASWCIPCIAEAPHLEAIADRGVPIDAIAIRDAPRDIARFLERYGDPYARIGLDADSSVQMAMGSSGVPETFVIDGQGVIRHQHIGAINEGDVPEILAAWEAAR